MRRRPSHKCSICFTSEGMRGVWGAANEQLGETQFGLETRKSHSERLPSANAAADVAAVDVADVAAGCQQMIIT